MVLAFSSSSSTFSQRHQPKYALFIAHPIVHVLTEALANGKVITSVAEATREDVDTAVKVAHQAFETVWGLNAPGTKRAALLNNLANLMEKHKDELAAIEALDNGQFLPPLLILIRLLIQDECEQERRSGGLWTRI